MRIVSPTVSAKRLFRPGIHQGFDVRGVALYTCAMAQKDLTGMVFGRLTALSVLPSLRPGDGLRWVCRCACGTECIVKTRLLTYKKGTRSCGCILREKNRERPIRASTNVKHGHTSRRHSPEYITWASMLQRCTNPKHTSYKHYGARGISVCREWAESFESFLADMGMRPPGKTLDRIDNELGYSKANCRWATDDEQANNRRRTAPVTAFGVKRTCRETAQLFGIPERTLYRWSQGGAVDVGSLITSSAARATTPSVV